MTSSAFEALLADLPPGETPDLHGGFPRLEEARIRTLEPSGERRAAARGDGY